MRRCHVLAFGLSMLMGASGAVAQSPAQPVERHAIVPEAKTKVYDESANARTQIANALAVAKRDHKRVLIQWGGNWCPWCIRMHELMQSDAAIAASLAANYELIHVDTGRPNGKNMDLVKQYGGTIEQFPYLTILDEDGKAVVNQDTRPFEMNREKGHEESVKSGHDPKMVLKFLNDNKSPLAKTVETAKAKKEPNAKLYDEAADAKQQIAAAVANAKKNNRRVLVQWGGNWCGWCLKLDEMMKANKQVSHELLYEYDVVHIDAGKPKGKNFDLASSYQASLEKDGFPFLTILDGDGKVVANSSTSVFELGTIEKGHDPEKVLAFLTKNQAAAVGAQAMLDKGLAEAKGAGKAVFLHFGAPWCGWCHRLENWMAKPEVAAILAKDFVDVKVDTDRSTGGSEMLNTYRKSDKGGIPWFVFLDGKGSALASSDGPSGNTGFPSDPPEIAHFETMLKKAKKNMTDGDIAKLVESLKGEKAAAGTAH